MGEIDFRILAGLEPVQTPPMSNAVLQLAQLRQIRQAERAQQADIALREAQAAQAAQEMAQQTRIQNALAAAAGVRTGQRPRAAPTTPLAAAAAPGTAPPVPDEQGLVELPGGTIDPAQLLPPSRVEPTVPQQVPQGASQAVLAASQVPPDPETFYAQPNAMQRLRALAPQVASELIKAGRDDLALKQESLSYVARGLSGVDTDAEYQAVLPELRQTLAQGGINPQILPGTYDKDAVANVRARGTTLDQVLKMHDQELRSIDQEIKQRAAAARLPAHLAGLTGEVKNRLAARGLLTPGNLAEPADVQAAIEENERSKLAVAGERSRQEFLNRALPSTIVTPLQETEQLLYLLGEVQRRFRPEYVGFFTGPGRRLKAKSGQLSENEIAWRQSMDLASELWNRARSGAAISASELQTFNRQIPTQGDPANVYRGKMQGMENFLRQHRSNLLALGTTTVGEARRGAIPRAAGTVDVEIVAPAADPGPSGGTSAPRIRSFRRIQ